MRKSTLLEYFGAIVLLVPMVLGQSASDSETSSLRCPRTGDEAFRTADNAPMHAYCADNEGGAVPDCSNALEDSEPHGTKVNVDCCGTTKSTDDATCCRLGTVYLTEPVKYASTTAAGPANKASANTCIGEACKAQPLTSVSTEPATSTSSTVLSFTASGSIGLTTVTLTITTTTTTTVSTVTKTAWNTSTTTGGAATGIIEETSVSGPQGSSSIKLSASSSTLNSTNVGTFSARLAAPSNSTAASAIPTMENVSGQSRRRLGFLAMALSGLAAVMGSML